MKIFILDFWIAGPLEVRPLEFWWKGYSFVCVTEYFQANKMPLVNILNMIWLVIL